MPLDLSPVIGHRGAAGLAPENTLAGFCKAAECGAGWVEFDLRLTADGRAVLLHDADTARIAGIPGVVAALPYAALSRLDAGGGERIPDLGAALALLSRLGLGGNIEIKPCPGREARTSAAVARGIASLGREAKAPPLLITSFSIPVLKAMAEAAPALPRGLLLRRYAMGWRGLCRTLGCVAVVCDHAGLSARRVAAVKAEGLALAAYTVNDPGRAGRLLSWGVDSVITDFPDRLRAVAAEVGR